MKNNTWQLQDAMHKEPQIVTKYGDNAVVVLSFDEYTKMTKQKTDLVKFFRNSPLADAALEITRSKDTPRDIGL